MTKADLIDEVSKLAELTRKDSEVIVETIFDSIVRSLRVGDKIEIRGFGSFRTRQRKPRVGRNPKTGERVEVPAKKIPFFKPSKELKDLVNTGGGLLSCYHLGDLTGMAESIRQLRGEAGERQIKDCDVVLTTGHGGELVSPGMCSIHTSTLLGRHQ